VRGQIACRAAGGDEPRILTATIPSTVCGVVLPERQTAILACQFTFACDWNSPMVVVGEPDAWERAMKIAAETIDGQLWLPCRGLAMAHALPCLLGCIRMAGCMRWTRMYKLGVHTFYRPLRRLGRRRRTPPNGESIAATTAAASKNCRRRSAHAALLHPRYLRSPTCYGSSRTAWC